MFGLFDKGERSGSEWKNLAEMGQLDDIVSESKEHPVVLFKHSTRCGISAMAKSRLEAADSEYLPVIYYLDLVRYRDISDAIADRFGVVHESPQVIVLKNGEPVYTATHGAINAKELQEYGV